METMLLKEAQVSRRTHRKSAFSLFEVLVVVAILFLLVAIILPTLARARAKSSKIGCVNNLKQVGLAFRIFANDHDDQYPWQVLTNQGTSQELLGLQPTVARLFRSMSNEFGSTWVLLCPDDTTRSRATNWASLTESNVSYFIGLDAREDVPRALLSGDRNLETNGIAVGSGPVILRSNTPVGWTKVIHRNMGNVCLGDGSVQLSSSAQLRELVQAQGTTTNRLLIP